MFKLVVTNIETGEIEMAQVLESAIVTSADSNMEGKSIAFVEGASIYRVACTVTTALEHLEKLCRDYPEVGKLVQDYFDGTMKREGSHLS